MPKSNGSSNGPDRPPAVPPQPAGRRPPIVVLTGPTGVGKTDLSLLLAERLGTDLINADSMQVYRYLDIGTAKPSREQRARVPHHLWDLVAPDEAFDAARYLRLARATVDALHGIGRIPILVGGTGLYLKILEQGLCPAPPSDPAVHRDLLEQLARFGSPALHQRLAALDPELAATLHPNDQQRIVRALEVCLVGGVPLSALQARHRFREARYPTIKIVLDRPRDQLHARIDRRVQEMIAAGFLEEVQSLLARGYGPELKPMQALGYRHLCRYLEGSRAWPETIADLQRATRRYAKRQRTWFRADPAYRWFDADDHNGVWDHLSRRLAALSP